MQDLLERLAHAATLDRPSVLATLIATHGARPRHAGAKLLVLPDGTTTGSVTLGGCVEDRVVEAARAPDADSEPRLLRVDLAEEEALDLGMGCAATLELLVEPVSAASPGLARDADRMRQHVARGKRGALVRNPDAPRQRLVVFEDGSMEGTLGHAALDARAERLAREAMTRRRSVLVPAEKDSPRLFIDVHAPPRTLYVFGTGPVAGPLLRMARELELRTVLIGTREAAAASAADDTRHGSPGEIAAGLPLDRDSIVVVVAHDYKQEVPVLEAVLRSEAAYVGVLGNRRRGQALLDLLAERGTARQALARVRMPAGLDLGAETPAEIALAILAEALGALRDRPGA